MKLSTLIFTSSLGALSTVLAVPLPSGTAQSNTLLSVLSRQQDLSTFSMIIQQSGGKRPNPAFEERFNSLLDTRNYTAFIPSNAAMLKLPAATLNLLARSQSYELTESLVRLHIAEGMYTAANLTSTPGQAQITAIEGFPLSFSATGTSIGSRKYTLNDVALNLTDIPASNGRIHTLDRMLNPYSSYFGISNSTVAPTEGSTDNKGTISDILASHPELSILNQQITAVDPDFLTRLSLSKPNDEKQIYLAPSNSAFASIPLDSMSAPSNVGLSRYLLRFGLLKGDLKALNMMDEGTVESVSGWNVTVKKTADAWMLGNAAVLERDVCAENGCVWIIDHLLDPLSGAMG